ncbi:hypothetical protein SAMN05421747_12048 [Parapedobacter composti]|uniref:Uncharacterized protein n=1 Tax=Parapedobacter composti TaxID=623281 RepID=A0A1I1LCD2_9SPHI|nr:hypothetical protein SAMN05421747_12048 [Parapedobacter composti]
MVMREEQENFLAFTELADSIRCWATDPQHYKGLNPYSEGGCCDFKKCCKKYKRGKRCKKCPKR